MHCGQSRINQFSPGEVGRAVRREHRNLEFTRTLMIYLASSLYRQCFRVGIGLSTWLIRAQMVRIVGAFLFSLEGQDQYGTGDDIYGIRLT